MGAVRPSRRSSIGTTSSSRLRVMTKPPTCWERWRGKAHDLVDERAHLLHAWAVDVDAGALELGFAHRAAAHAPDRRRQRADRVLGEAEGLADLADGRAPAIGDHGRGDAGAVAAVFLDRCTGSPPRAARARNRRRCRAARRASVEMKRSNRRSPRTGSTDGDAEAVADRRIRRRAAALAEDALASARSGRCRGR